MTEDDFYNIDELIRIRGEHRKKQILKLMNSERFVSFIRELNSLFKKYGYQIGGCGCDGSFSK